MVTTCGHDEVHANWRHVPNTSRRAWGDVWLLDIDPDAARGQRELQPPVKLRDPCLVADAFEFR
jgi:hypothetical protein